MKIPELVLVAIFAVTPVSAQVAPIHFPTDGNGLLEYCGEAVKAFDDPSSTLRPTGQGVVDMELTLANSQMKQGWCAGYLQAMRYGVLFEQIQVVKAIAIINGEQNASAEMLQEVVSKQTDNTCIPNEVSLQQMARLLVKWLRDHPEKLHEYHAGLTLNALHAAFPCPGDIATKKPNAK